MTVIRRLVAKRIPFSGWQIREGRIDPGFDELVELSRLLHDLVRLGLGRDVRARVIDDVALSAAPFEVVRVLVYGTGDSELDAVERYLVMADLGGDAIARTRDRHGWPAGPRCTRLRIVDPQRGPRRSSRQDHVRSVPACR